MIFAAYLVGFFPAIFAGIIWQFLETLSIGARLAATILAGALPWCWPALSASSTPRLQEIGYSAALLFALGAIATSVCCMISLLKDRR